MDPFEQGRNSLQDYLNTENEKAKPDQTAYDYYDENGNYIGSGNVKKGDPDPVGQTVYRNPDGTYSPLPNDYTKAVSVLAESYTPTIKIKGDNSGFILSGSKTALKSGLADELRNYLKETFKYADLASANVADAIDKLNKDLQEQIQKSVVESTGGNYEWFKDYANAKETMQRQNPMALEGDEARDKYGIWGYDKNGNRVKKLPQEWINYWRENYSQTERAALYDYSRSIVKGAADADKEVMMDYNLWTPYLVMSGGEGGDSPVYGFDPWEQFVAGAASFTNELNKFGEGLQRGISGAAWFLTNPQSYIRRNSLNDIVHKFGVSDDVLSKDVEWMSEKAWKDKMDSIIGKKVDELTDDEKKFLATALSDKFNNNNVLQIITNDDGTINDNMLKETVDTPSGQRVGGNVTYQDYINARDNLSTLEEYDARRDEINENKGKYSYDWRNLENDVDLAQRVYAPVNVGVGSFAGVILRTLAESGLISSLTGGLINPSSIGDTLAEGIIKVTTKAAGAIPTATGIAKALNSPLGKFLLSLTMEIPEDVVQTAIDNVIIDQADENATLLTPDNIARNTAENLVFRAIFGVGTKALDYVSTKNAIKKLKGQTKLLDAVDTDQLFDEWQQFKTAREGGNIRFNEQGNAVITDANGNEKVLENVHANIFNNTGDAQLDAIGAQWREEHYQAPMREKLRQMRNDSKKYVQDVLGVQNDIDAKTKSGEIKYTGVQNVVTVPSTDPYYGIRGPELKMWGFNEDNTPFASTDQWHRNLNDRTWMMSDWVRTKAPVTKRPDMSGVLNEKALHKAEIHGALNDAREITEFAFEQDTDGSYSPDYNGINKMYGEDSSYATRWYESAKGAEYEYKNTPGFNGKNIDEIKKNVTARVDHLKKKLEDILAEYENYRKVIRDTFGASRIEEGGKLDDAIVYITNVLGRLDNYGDEIVDDIVTLAQGGKNATALRRIFGTIASDKTKAKVETNLAKAMADDVHKNGAPIKSDIETMGRFVDTGDGKGVIFINTTVSGADVPDPTDKYGWNANIHIPEGTNILRLSDAPEDAGKYVVDATAGVVEKNGELYVNNTDGSAHTPVNEKFNGPTYEITQIKGKDGWNESFLEGYHAFGKDYLKPVGKDRTKASDDFYDLVKGGGSKRFSPNVTSERLRSSGELGQLNPTTPATLLDKIMHDAVVFSESPLYPSSLLGKARTGSDLSGVLSEAFDPNADMNIGGAKQALHFWNNAFDMYEKLDTPGGVDSDEAHLVNLYMSPEIATWGKTPAGREFRHDLKAIENWLGDIDGSSFSNMSPELKEQFASKLFDLSIKYQGDNGFSELPLAYQVINAYKYAAPYEAKKPFTVYRGMRRDMGGNGIGRNSTGSNLFSLKVGDDWVDNGYAFTSLSPNYAGGYGEVIFRYNIPEGAPVIYYGDPEHFGRYSAVADGGPIVLPRSWPAKVTKITQNGPNTVIDISFADKNGNYANLVTPRDVLKNKLKGTTYKGKRLGKALDAAFGEGSGEVILDAVAKGGDIEDITYDKIYKYLNTQQASDLNRYLFHQLETEPLILFRGQKDGRITGEIDIDRVGFSNEDTIRNLSPNGNIVDIEEAGGYPFTQDPNNARQYGDNLVRVEIDRKYILTENEASLASDAALEELDELGIDTKDYDTKKDLLSEKSRLIMDSMGTEDATRNMAMATGKPIVEYTKPSGEVVYAYFPGVNEDFDRSMVINMYDSEAVTTPQASVANQDMAADVFHAVESQPYNKSAAEIVDELYKRMPVDTLPDSTPNSASPKWDAPRMEKSYYKEGHDTRYTVRHALADMPVDPTQLNNWHDNSLNSIMESFTQNFIPEFTKVYKTPEDQSTFVRNMDYLFHLQKHEKVALVNAIGKEYTVDGVTYKITLEDTQFYKNFVEPQMRDLRDASKKALGVDIPTTVGYFPHTDYSPENLTSEEILQGVLWKHYTGASAMEDGTFTTAKLSDDIATRYRTFVNNMLWDIAGDRVAAAKFMEELHADGVDVTAEQANKAIKAKKKQAEIIEKSAGAKKAKAELKKEKGEIDWNEINDSIKNYDGGEAWAIKYGYGDMYGSARGNYSQPGGKASIWTADHVSTMSVSDWMRAMITPDGSLYNQGGAMVVNGDAAAKFMANRMFDENMNGAQFKEMLVEYLTDGRRRSAKGAEYVADKWMKKIAARANNAPITRASLASDLQWMIRYEGINRIDRWIARADLNQFSKKNMSALNEFIRRQGIISSNTNDSGLMGKINTLANKATSARMKSLFWFNFKNGVLQTSECIRLFTEFKIGDALATIKNLALDKEFRDEVNEWVDMIVPDRYTDVAGEGGKARMLEGTAEAWAVIARNSSITKGELTVGKLSPKDIKELGKSFDKFASSPIDFGENAKNRVLMAGILQEAKRKGLSGNELFNYVNKRFERIGLAANDMGRLTAADNPFFRLATNLKSFGIRESNMYINNIRDLNDADGMAAAMGYVIKNLGWKGGLVLLMSKLGYGALSVFGLDPFGLLDDQYTGVDEENYNFTDRVVTNPAVNALLSGGFTSFIPMLYWASRQSYENNVTLTDDAERSLDPHRPAIELGGIGWDQILKIGTGFVPGYTQGQREINMIDLMNRGWATGSTGNKKYEAPNDFLNTAAGFIFGPSNTANARAYNQTPDYLQGFIDNGIAGVGQQIGREWGGYRQFDPISQDYSDWFNGSKADEAQWRAGYTHFAHEIESIINTYRDSLSKSYSDEDSEKLNQSYNEQLRKLMDNLKTFTDAYTAKHPEGIDEEKMNNLLNILNTYRRTPGINDEEEKERRLAGWNMALQRYSEAGLPAITTYRGNTEEEREETGDNTTVQYSPQLRAALQGEFGLPQEAAAQIRQLYKDKWKDLNQRYRDELFSTKGSKAKKAIQERYINIVRQDLDPIVRLYGNNIWSNEDVENIIDDVFNSMVPKYGQSAKSYLKELYKNYHGKVQYSERSDSTLEQIDRMLDQGRTAQAKALARTLLQRVGDSRAFVNREQLEKLQRILND